MLTSTSVLTSFLPHLGHEVSSLVIFIVLLTDSFTSAMTVFFWEITTLFGMVSAITYHSILDLTLLEKLSFVNS